MKCLERDHARRQPFTAAAKFGHPFAPVRGVMDQQAGLLAAGLAISCEQGLDTQSEVSHARISVAHGAGRTNAGARAAAHAQMRLDLDVIAVGADRRGRADVDAPRAASDFGAAVGADFFLVGEEFRLFELADHLRELARRLRLLERVPAGGQITLRRLVHSEQRCRPEIEHQVKTFIAAHLAALEIDRPDFPARPDTLAVRLAFLQIDLIAVVDRMLGARSDARVAAGAGIEIDRIDLVPDNLERAEITGELVHLPAEHRVTAFGRQLAPAIGHQDANAELPGELLGPREGSRAGTDDQQLAGRAV